MVTIPELAKYQSGKLLTRNNNSKNYKHHRNDPGDNSNGETWLGKKKEHIF